MELKTESGVSITIIDEGSSKVLLFDKLVRAVQLNDEEISRIKAELSPRMEDRGSALKEKQSTQGQKATKDDSEVC